MSAAAIYDHLADVLDCKLPEEAILDLAEWIAKLIETARLEGRQDGLWDS